MTDRIGQQLGHYQLVRLLGKGGFAEVYLGEHLHLGTQVAIKLLYAQLHEEEAIEQFRREARLVAQLKHPHIVRVLDFGIENDLGGMPFLVMDYAPGGTLRQRHPRGTLLALPTIVDYVKQIAQALQYAHDRKLIHRDIKPENMLIGENGELLLSDFGIAVMSQSSRYAGVQDIVGTVTYMAPEQIQAHPRLVSDRYALAVVVYEWLSGQPPFRGSYTEVMAKHCAAPVPSLRGQLPLPPEVEQGLFIALAKDPKERFASVQAFANAFEQVATGKLKVGVSETVTAVMPESEEKQPTQTQVGAEPNPPLNIGATLAAQTPVFKQGTAFYSPPVASPTYTPTVPQHNRVQTRRRFRLSSLLIVLCSVICLGGSLLTNVALKPLNQQVDLHKLDDGDKNVMVSAFYDLLREQRYDLAYNGLAQSATIEGQQVNLSTFTQIAQKAEVSRGQTNYAFTAALSMTSGTGTQVYVGRDNKPSYTETMTIVQENGHWRIQTADNL